MFEIMRLDGQRVVIERNKILYIHLREGPFLSAGRVLKWAHEGPGLGINKSVLRLANLRGWRIRVFVGDRLDRCYETHPDAFFEFTESFENKYLVKNTELMLLPWNELYFETITDFPKEVLKYLGRQ